MRRLNEFFSQLGPPLRDLDTSPLERVAADWGVTFPPDLLEVLTAYGDAVISGQIFLLGPRTLRQAGIQFGPLMLSSLGEQQCPELLPVPGGFLLWATTPDDDSLCLRQDGESGWLVSFYDGQNLQWIHTQENFSDWLYAGLVGEPKYAIFPPWPAERPHVVSLLGPDPFGADATTQH
jgi:hypothetical protein